MGVVSEYLFDVQVRYEHEMTMIMTCENFHGDFPEGEGVLLVGAYVAI